jgi:transposase
MLESRGLHLSAAAHLTAGGHARSVACYCTDMESPSREIRLLVDHREDLVAERTRQINRIRWHFHEIDPEWEPKERGLTAFKNIDAAEQRLDGLDTVIARITRNLLRRIRELTVEINALTAELDERTRERASNLRAVPGVGALSAAKFIGEVAGVSRFKSRHAFARHNGTAPLPAWSGNRERHRLSRTGNRQLNAALHRIALTQARYHPDAIAFIERRKADGDSGKEAVRALKRRLSDVVHRAMITDSMNETPCPAAPGAHLT